MSNRFHPVRDQGLALIGMNTRKTIEYAAGVFNGNLLNRAANDNKDYMYVGRFVWTPFGEYKLEESSLDYPETPKLALGVNWMENTLGRITSTANLKTDIERLNGEVAFKWRGFNAVAEYCEETSTPQATNVDTDSDGYYVQVGYLFPNQKFEIAGRTSEFDARPVVSSAFPDVTEEGLAFSWYFSKHNHKLQADWLQFERQTSPTAAPVKTDEMRLQLQLVF